MKVSGIDHVNILTNDLEATASFYEQTLDLERRENPAIGNGTAGYWMCDSTGHPVIHLVDKASTGTRYEGYDPGGSTNAFHHVALRCEGFDATRSRLEGMGVTYRINDLSHIGLRQIFLPDPNAVNLELNFSGD